MMTLPKMMRIVVPAVIGVTLVAAVVVGRERTKKVATIPAGTLLVAALDDAVSTEHNHVGDGVVLKTVEPLRLAGGVEIPAGVVIRGTVAEAKGGGSIAGAPVLALTFTDIEVDGERQPIAAAPFRVMGKSEGGKSAAQIGGGAVAGGIVGRVLGGKSGTVPGAVVGAAIGTGVALQSQGGELSLAAGQHLKVRLSEPVTVTYRPAER